MKFVRITLTFALLGFAFAIETAIGDASKPAPNPPYDQPVINEGILGKPVVPKAVPIAGPGMVDIGTAKDGDDIILKGFDFRLQGIAAPEDNAAKVEPGGPEATKSLHEIVDGKLLRCVPDGTTTRGRHVAQCFFAQNETDIGELQVLAGHARDCPRFSHGRYSTAEATARRAGRDLSVIYPLPGYCAPR